VGIKPSLWVGLKPFGIGEQRPNNYAEIWRAAAENKDNLRYALRILKDGCCDGCALGTSGVKDWTIDGVHLCNIRLRLLRLNTMGALDESLLSDVAGLSRMRSSELRDLGRIPFPLIRLAGEPGFTRVTWDEALDLIAGRISESEPDRTGYYLTSRGMPNESYYAAQKAVRAMGSNNIDNAARICHSPSTSALKQTLGIAATTCSYTDWVGSDVIVFIGSNIANNQPVAMKYLYLARKAGTKVVMINPYREPGMERYWIPSSPESAVFGTKMTDEFFSINIGGDVAFLNGVFKHLCETGQLDRTFIEAHTSGFEEAMASVGAQPWSDLEKHSGAPEADMRRLGDILGAASTGVLVWSMGITQHEFGEDNVRSIVNLALAKGFIGRDRCGVMPIRGHSGVQGGAEMGAYSTAFPGGLSITKANAERLGEHWGFQPPVTEGHTTTDMIDLAHRGALDVMFSSGGNFLEVLPDPGYTREALERVPLRVHMDIVLSSQMFADPADVVVVLPAATRYEMPGGSTETSTERRIIFSPEIPGPRIEEARPEWWVFTELARRVRPDLAGHLAFDGTPAIRDEIARVVPAYAGVERFAKKGDQIQYGGPHLCADGRFETPDGRGLFSSIDLPSRPAPDGWFLLTTRRGKQFNSMVHENKDALTGATREAVMMSEVDATRLSLAPGDKVLLRNDLGSMHARVTLAPMQPGSLQVHWPEGQVLIDAHRRSPEARIPDFNAFVEVVPV
jgi:molybdopterin-dependent oxidoreductase alpha subunit